MRRRAIEPPSPASVFCVEPLAVKTPKAVPVVLRHRGDSTEVLVFAHPKAGTQIVKGTVEAGEPVADACVRELAEESGIVGAACLRDLGVWEHCPSGQVWHFREMFVADALPDSWTHHTNDGGGLLFRFYWHALDRSAPVSCHRDYVRALAFLQGRLAELANNRSFMSRCEPT